MSADRDRQVVDQLHRGASVIEVGRAHGLASPGASIRLVDRALDAVLPRLSPHLRRRLDLQRLDKLVAAWWEPAVTGDLGAAGLVLAAIDVRHRLGLADEPGLSEPQVDGHHRPPGRAEAAPLRSAASR
jgi:hypothetical protein